MSFQTQVQFRKREECCSCTSSAGRDHCRLHGRQQYSFERHLDRDSEPDGFRVFGRFPRGWLKDVIRLRLLGDVRRDEILHVCSGTLMERWTVDLRPSARPRVVADGCHLPFRDASFKAVLCDPPYSDEYARKLYGTGMPRPSWLLREAGRVVVPGGRIGILHVAVPFNPDGCRLVNIWGVTTGIGYRMRAFTVYEKQAARLFAEP